MAFAFQKLHVYQKAVDFADQICSKTENFARGYGFLCDQLNRASMSIAAHLVFPIRHSMSDNETIQS